MDEKRTDRTSIRPTKKQRELLEFIGRFIKEHGYSPSYREIMRGCDYTSVATVALHINGLIARGHLVKRDRSARSLELTESSDSQRLMTNQVQPGEERWLVEKVEYFFEKTEASATPSTDEITQLEVLLAALKVLGLVAAAQSFSVRLAKLKQQ